METKATNDGRILPRDCGTGIERQLERLRSQDYRVSIAAADSATEAKRAIRRALAAHLKALQTRHARATKSKMQLLVLRYKNRGRSTPGSARYSAVRQARRRLGPPARRSQGWPTASAHIRPTSNTFEMRSTTSCCTAAGSRSVFADRCQCLQPAIAALLKGFVSVRIYRRLSTPRLLETKSVTTE